MNILINPLHFLLFLIVDSMPIKGGAISLGRKSGIAETKGGSVLPEFVITKLKSGDMASGKVWSTMQQKPPKY